MKKTRGWTKVPTKLLRSPYLSPVEKTLFLYLCSYKKAFPSYQIITKHTGLAKNTIAKSIKVLVQRNMLRYVQGSGRRKMANLYRILPDYMWKLDGIKFDPHTGIKFAPPLILINNIAEIFASLKRMQDRIDKHDRKIMKGLEAQFKITGTLDSEDDLAWLKSFLSKNNNTGG